jgi:hypothetical protein
MRLFLRVVLLLVLLTTVAAQRRGFAPMPRPAPASGISPPITTPPVAIPPAAAFGGWRKPDASRSRSDQPSVVVMPYAAPYPVYVESQAPTADGDNPQEYLPPPIPPAAPPQQPAHGDSNAVLAPCAGASNPPLALPMAPAPKGDPPSFYIALNDGWVYLARAYWVENDTLHYLTGNGRHNQVSLALVNRDVSIRLNAKRADEFHLPPSE